MVRAICINKSLNWGVTITVFFVTFSIGSTRTTPSFIKLKGENDNVIIDSCNENSLVPYTDLKSSLSSFPENKPIEIKPTLGECPL